MDKVILVVPGAVCVKPGWLKMERQDEVRGGRSQGSHQVKARADMVLLCHFGGCDIFHSSRRFWLSPGPARGPLSSGKLRYLGSVRGGVEATMLEPSPGSHGL